MDKIPLNVSELKQEIDKLINEYYTKKIITVIKEISNDYDLDCNDLFKKYDLESEIRVDAPNSQCTGVKLNGEPCTHKCAEGFLFCKKHIKDKPKRKKYVKKEETDFVDSYFPTIETL